MGHTALSKTGGKMSDLNDKQRLFVLEYLVSLNGKEAATKAGYPSPSNASTRLLRNPRIARIIGKIQKEDVEKLELDRYETLKQLFYCYTRTMDDFCDEEGKIITNVHQMSERAKAAIDGIDQEVTTDKNGSTTIKTKLRLVPKAKAIEMAMKHGGLFEPEQVNVNVKHKLCWDDLYNPSEKLDTVEEKIKNVGNKRIVEVAKEGEENECHK